MLFLLDILDSYFVLPSEHKHKKWGIRIQLLIIIFSHGIADAIDLSRDPTLKFLNIEIDWILSSWQL